MSHCPPLKGRPRLACETLHALGGQATGGDICRAAGFPRNSMGQLMTRLVSVRCVRVVNEDRPRIYALTSDWRARMGDLPERAPEVDDDALDDPAQDVPPEGFRTSIPAAPWTELAGAWR